MSSARTAYRIEIEGLDVQPVTDEALEQVLADGRERIAGLVRDGLQISEKCDIAHADLQVEGMQISIVDRQHDDRWTRLVQRPSRTTWLLSALSAGGTTIECAHDIYTVGDVVHAGTEAMRIATAAGGGVYTVQRGYWGTIPVAISPGTGGDLSYHELTDRPSCIEGRRCRIYRYVDGIDDMQGDGSQIWIGICTTDARLQSGTIWQIYVDSVWSLMDQGLGSDLQAPFLARGIYYPSSAPLQIAIQDRGALSTWGAMPGDDWTLQSLDDYDWLITLAGFWETDRDLVASLTPIFEALRVGASHPALLRRTGAPDPYIVPTGGVGGNPWGLLSYTRRLGIGGSPSEFPWSEADSRRVGAAIVTSAWTPAAPAAVSVTITGSGVPRGNLVPSSFSVTLGLPTAPLDMRIPIDRELSTVQTPIEMSTKIDGEDYVASGTYYPYALGVDRVIALDSIETSDGARPWSLSYRSPQLSIVREIARGNFADFIDQLKLRSPELSGIGASPLITDADIETPSALVSEIASGVPQLSDRTYAAADEVDLSEMISEECKLLGIFPHLASDGRITFSRLALPSPVALSAFSIGPSQIIVDNGAPSWERNSSGSLNVVRMRTGYDFREDEHRGAEFTVRDVAALSSRRSVKRLRISPKSREMSPWTPFLVARYVGQGALSIFGRPYVSVTLEIPWTLANVALVGAIVDVSLKDAPDAITGARGFEGRGLIVGRMWALDQEERVQIDVILSDELAPLSAYTPSAWGTMYGGTIKTPSTARDGVSVSDEPIFQLFPVGTVIMAQPWDGGGSTVYVGTVTAVSSMDISVSWSGDTPPNGDYRIGFAPLSVALTQSQRRFGFWTDLSLDRPAQRWVG